MSIELFKRSPLRKCVGRGLQLAVRPQLNIRLARAYSTPATTEADLKAGSSPMISAGQFRKAAKEEGSIASVFATLSGGSLSTSLPDRFRDLKRSIVQNEAHAIALQEAWLEILAALNEETKEVIDGGDTLIPQVQYPGDEIITKETLDCWLDKDTIASVKKRGTVVIKGVIPERIALQYKQNIRDYVGENPQTKGFPEDNPQVFELYWSRPQLAARSHPSLLAASTACLSLFHAPSQSKDTSSIPPTGLHPGDSAFALGPHIDGGGVERWEDDTFRGVWNSILQLNESGKIEWRKHDSWSLGWKAERLGAQTDMYNGAGACSVFRPLQGWLSMSSTGANEGTLRVLPILQSATAYIILRPFFRSKKE